MRPVQPSCWYAVAACTTGCSWRAWRRCWRPWRAHPRPLRESIRTSWRPVPSPGWRASAWQSAPATYRRPPARARRWCWVGSTAGRSEETSDGEGRPAAAGGLGVRIADHELRAFEILDVVDLGALQILPAHRIDQQRNAVLLDDGVAVLNALIEGEPVLEAGAAATGDIHPQLELVVLLLLDELPHLVGGGIGKDQRYVLFLSDFRHLWPPRRQSLHIG